MPGAGLLSYHRISASLRKTVREIAYATPLYRWLRLGEAQHDRTFWDQKLAGDWKTYLGGTFSIEARNVLVGALLRQLRPGTASVLDLGCAAGSLAATLRADVVSYFGVDISEVAVEQARRDYPDLTFRVSDLESFVTDRTFDVIIFSEVLYYLGPDQAADQAARYAKFLNDGGLIIVSMKDEPKSARIFDNLNDRFRWMNGALIQEKAVAPDYRVRPNRQRPAHLIGAFETLPA